MTKEMKKPTKVAVAFLSYRDDSDVLLEAERAAIRAFAQSNTLEPTFVLVDDAWCPVTEEARKKFLSAHPSTYHVMTGYRRGPMILGQENLLGQCKAFESLADQLGVDILLKVDSDTCLFKVDWIEEFAQNPDAYCAGAFDFGNQNHTSVFGLCYAIKASILPDLARDVETYPAHHKAWEDHEMSSRVFRLCDGRMNSLLRWRSNTPGDDFWVIPLAQANETLINARAANCAWDFSRTTGNARKEYRMKVHEWMKKWNDLLEERS